MNQRAGLFLAGAMVLAAGLLSGGLIYFIADEERESTSYVVVGDTAYPVDPTRSKAYVRQLERFGGKAAVLFDDFNRWFAGLWVGRALGITVGWISMAAAAVIFWIARRTPK